MANIVLDKLVKRFGKQVAVNELSIEIRDREFMLFLARQAAARPRL